MRGMVMALAVAGVLCVAGSSKVQAADGDQNFAGTFVWNNQAGKTHPIKAVFTPTGDKKWNVVFTFTWGGRGDQTYKGTAEGTLKDGEIKGDVNSTDGRRKFDFKGTFKDGQFDCTHNEKTSGKPQATGTMTIKKG